MTPPRWSPEPSVRVTADGSRVTPEIYRRGMEERTPHTADAPPAIDLPAGAQDPLPFDDEAEHPIPFALTARARRTVAPHDLPPLRVVSRSDASVGSEPDGAAAASVANPADADEAGSDPSDTRPARARALRRSGVPTAAIADQLGVDELLVRAWTGKVPVARSLRAGRAGAAPEAAVHAGGRDAREEAARTAFELARAAARDVARQRLVDQPQLAAGLGVLAGVADITPAAVDVTTTDPRLAGAVVRWLTEVLGADPAEVRLVLRVGPRAAADLARHRWGRAVGIAPDRVRTTRAVASVADDAVEALLRVVDADLAAAAAGWRDALLDPVADDTEF